MKWLFNLHWIHLIGMHSVWEFTSSVYIPLSFHSMPFLWHHSILLPILSMLQHTLFYSPCLRKLLKLRFRRIRTTRTGLVNPSCTQPRRFFSFLVSNCNEIEKYLTCWMQLYKSGISIIRQATYHGCVKTLILPA